MLSVERYPVPRFPVPVGSIVVAQLFPDDVLAQGHAGLAGQLGVAGPGGGIGQEWAGAPGVYRVRHAPDKRPSGAFSSDLGVLACQTARPPNPAASARQPYL
jgi:hypothetical protein